MLETQKGLPLELARQPRLLENSSGRFGLGARLRSFSSGRFSLGSGRLDHIFGNTD